MPAAKASDPSKKWSGSNAMQAKARVEYQDTPKKCLTARKMEMPAAKASDPRPKKCWLLTLHPPVSACRMVTCVNPCQCLARWLSDPARRGEEKSA